MVENKIQDEKVLGDGEATMLNEKNNTIKAVIFDCDGTLLDTENIYVSTWYSVCEEYGYELPEKLIKETRGKSGTEAIKLFYNYLGEDFPLERINEKRAILNEEIFYNTPVEKILKPGVCRLFGWLEEQGIKIAVASGRRYEITSEHLKYAGLFDRVNIVIGRDLVKNNKPEPDMFIKAAEFMGVSCKECLVVGDTISDYKAAQAAGMRIAFVPDMFPADEEIAEGAFAVLKQIDQVIEVVGIKER